MRLPRAHHQQEFLTLEHALCPVSVQISIYQNSCQLGEVVKQMLDLSYPSTKLEFLCPYQIPFSLLEYPGKLLPIFDWLELHKLMYRAWQANIIVFTFLVLFMEADEQCRHLIRSVLQLDIQTNFGLSASWHFGQDLRVHLNIYVGLF